MRIPRLLMHLWHKDRLEVVGNYLGSFIEVDMPFLDSG